MTTESELIQKVVSYARETFENDYSGHDFHHTTRVFRLASFIAEREGADILLVQLASLLHDVDDYKLFGGHAGQTQNARRFLTLNHCTSDTIESVCLIISQISFKAADSIVPDTLEGRIVQDADRLDAIGAIGIARAFAYGGSHHRSIHEPDIHFNRTMTKDEYTKNQGTTINHFFEKLLKLKDMMNTETARELAQARHDFMQLYLEEFFEEWNGNR